MQAQLGERQVAPCHDPTAVILGAHSLCLSIFEEYPLCFDILNIVFGLTIFKLSLLFKKETSYQHYSGKSIQ